MTAAGMTAAAALLWCCGDRRRQREYEHRRQGGFSRDGVNKWPHVGPLSDVE
jgi:hypothetical protein